MFWLTDQQLEDISSQSYPILFNPMYHSPPGCSVRRTVQARILEHVAMFFSRGSSQPRDQTEDLIKQIKYIFFIGRWILYHLHHQGKAQGRWEHCIYLFTFQRVAFPRQAKRLKSYSLDAFSSMLQYISAGNTHRLGRSPQCAEVSWIENCSPQS